jgi:hypothetical protein
MPPEDAMRPYDPLYVNDPNKNNSGRKSKRQEATVRIERAINAALSELNSDEAQLIAFLRLLACVRERTSFLKPAPGLKGAGWAAAVFLINRLRNLATRHHFWIRPCETWDCSADNLRPSFRSLAHHLFAHYPVPGFMDSAWDLPAGPQAFREQACYIRLGRGASFRSLNLALALTRRMEHHARHAHDHYSVNQALRYGETRGLGGTENLAREIAASRLGQETSESPFWRTVLMFLAAHPEMSLKYVRPIIEYLHAIKFGGEEVLTVHGPETRRAPWPNFSMSGRTPQSLLRLVRAWCSDLTEAESNILSWEQSGIRPYRYLERRLGEEDLDWSILELLNSGALHAEGRAMCHCVHSYARKCKHGDSHIWSLRLRADGMEKRMATIEVDPRTRAIIQVRAKRNRAPGHRSSQIIRQWAAYAGLGF